ncbi:3-isopropylmalate dehydratase small subunit [Streptomyces sp. AP-93]|uniref:3-isopropylmalate dehydratase small subunit n=1 Tax=Streptomyces sp. AP-93 TaxID=2929048 RepID=UPI001FAF2820|nr:3-isopropylmalate dehydratase small subunit [Streptomyces sp. AP-93]MCJ0875399.1 3-isopropylmalate dehydratase small subunit [Streptomyces sp. AP-93]
MDPFVTHTGTGMPLRRSNIDTDQIIPARYVPYFSWHGHTNALFADWRDDPSFVLNLPQYQGATVLVSGNDFGTGSSRESAVWALQRAGFAAVIAPRFGDIFSGNALMRGLVTATVPEDVVVRLWEQLEQDPSTPVTVDVQGQEVRCAGITQPFALDPGARRHLLSGQDAVAETLKHADEIEAYERLRRPLLPMTHFTRAE